MTDNTHRYSFSSIMSSWFALPLWVQIWVGLMLVPANGAAFFIMDTPTGCWAVIAIIFVAATNMPILIYEGGMSRLMAIPHLIAWFPLSAYIIARLTGYCDSDVELQTPERIFAIVLLIINGISLAFDSLDTIKWFKGERDIPGH